MSMNMGATMVSTMTTSTLVAVATSTVSKAMSMGDSGGCKLSMLLNWHTIDACFLSSTLHIRTPFTFFLTCVASFLLVISLEFLRRLQRIFDRYLRARHATTASKSYSLAEDTAEKLLEKDEGVVHSRRWLSGQDDVVVVVVEQLARGCVHAVQFAVSYVVMLLFMYSNGYIILSIILGSLVGFALFARDTVISRTKTAVNDEGDKMCC